MQIPTKYDSREELIMDMNILGKILQVPSKTMEELTKSLKAEYRLKHPLPSLEQKRYEISETVSNDFYITNEEELVLGDNETLINLSGDDDETIIIDTSEIKVTDEAKLFFRYENSVTPSIMEEFLKGETMQYEGGIDSVTVTSADESYVLDDSEIEMMSATTDTWGSDGLEVDLSTEDESTEIADVVTTDYAIDTGEVIDIDIDDEEVEYKDERVDLDFAVTEPGGHVSDEDYQWNAGFGVEDYVEVSIEEVSDFEEAEDVVDLVIASNEEQDDFDNDFGVEDIFSDGEDIAVSENDESGDTDLYDTGIADDEGNDFEDDFSEGSDFDEEYEEELEDDDFDEDFSEESDFDEDEFDSDEEYEDELEDADLDEAEYDFEEESDFDEDEFDSDEEYEDELEDADSDEEVEADGDVVEDGDLAEELSDYDSTEEESDFDEGYEELEDEDSDYEEEQEIHDTPVVDLDDNMDSAFIDNEEPIKKPMSRNKESPVEKPVGKLDTSDDIVSSILSNTGLSNEQKSMLLEAYFKTNQTTIKSDFGDIPVTDEPVKEKKPVEEETYKDIRDFVRKHPRCRVSQVLEHFSRKALEDEIRKGRLIRKGDIIHRV